MAAKFESTTVPNERLSVVLFIVYSLKTYSDNEREELSFTVSKFVSAHNYCFLTYLLTQKCATESNLRITT